MDATVDLLRRVPFLRSAADGDLQRLARLVESIEIPAGHELIAQGSRSAPVFVIVNGTATSSVGGTRFETIGPGGIVGHLALLDHGRHHATVTADDAMTLIVIPRRHFDAFMNDPAVRGGLTRLLAARMRFAEAELANIDRWTLRPR